MLVFDNWRDKDSMSRIVRRVAIDENCVVLILIFAHLR